MSPSQSSLLKQLLPRTRRDENVASIHSAESRCFAEALEMRQNPSGESSEPHDRDCRDLFHVLATLPVFDRDELISPAVDHALQAFPPQERGEVHKRDRRALAVCEHADDLAGLTVAKPRFDGDDSFAGFF